MTTAKRAFRLTPPRHPQGRRRLIGDEAAVQIAIVEHLQRYGVRHCIYFHVPNEGLRSQAYGAVLRRMGLLKGVADLFIGVPGQPPGFLEIKQPGEGQTLDQRAFQALCQANGSRYQVVYNLDHALSVLRAWGALRVAEVMA